MTPMEIAIVFLIACVGGVTLIANGRTTSRKDASRTPPQEKADITGGPGDTRTLGQKFLDQVKAQQNGGPELRVLPKDEE